MVRPAPPLVPVIIMCVAAIWDLVALFVLAPVRSLTEGDAPLLALGLVAVYADSLYAGRRSR